MKEVKALDAGKCRYCGASIYWTRSAKNNKPMPVQVKITTIVDKHGQVVSGHESHVPYCPNFPGNKKGNS